MLRRRTNIDLGPARDPVESRLGCGPSALLGFKTASGHLCRYGQGRSTTAIGGIGEWEWSDHTPFDNKKHYVYYEFENRYGIDEQINPGKLVWWLNQLI